MWTVYDGVTVWLAEFRTVLFNWTLVILTSSELLTKSVPFTAREKLLVEKARLTIKKKMTKK